MMVEGNGSRVRMRVGGDGEVVVRWKVLEL